VLVEHKAQAFEAEPLPCIKIEAGCEGTCAASITLSRSEANLHGRDARATWHGHLAHVAPISSKARCMGPANRFSFHHEREFSLIFTFNEATWP